ncbi:hypothetical protein E2C01_043339 [Portunus trituberculatus]|uniref:Uncharacterized protein n=1 Tax=Portunus trituberculatus TaxID=210409 RepID=A0A5B7FW18_PORTR|nr:hypothetical protein [Portunus trituberculatus]
MKEGSQAVTCDPNKVSSVPGILEALVIEVELYLPSIARGEGWVMVGALSSQRPGGRVAQGELMHN